MDSSAASKETIRTRRIELSKHRSLTSRGADVVQLQEEIKARTSMEHEHEHEHEHEQILSELHKGGFKVEVPVKQILALNADLCIPWTKMQEVRR